jgi:hypothetical protein
MRFDMAEEQGSPWDNPNPDPVGDLRRLKEMVGPNVGLHLPAGTKFSYGSDLDELEKCYAVPNHEGSMANDPRETRTEEDQDYEDSIERFVHDRLWKPCNVCLPEESGEYLAVSIRRDNINPPTFDRVGTARYFKEIGMWTWIRFVKGREIPGGVTIWSKSPIEDLKSIEEKMPPGWEKPDQEITFEDPQSIGRWIEETFPGGDPMSPRKCLRMIEEAVELCVVAGASFMDIWDAVDAECKKIAAKPPRDDSTIKNALRHREPDKIGPEAADVYIVLCGVAALYGFDLDREATAKMRVNRARKWKARGDGTGYHVKS